MNIKAYAAQNAESPLSPFSIVRRSVLPSDVLIEILYCGVCHSDIHQAKGEWGKTSFPIVPGHEIVGRVAEVGKEVTQFKKGDLAGVGCFIDSCRTCESCQNGLEQYCEGHVVSTYNGTEKDGITPTYGGYSTHIVVDQKYTLKIPQVLAEKGITRIAPLLCAGITTYSDVAASLSQVVKVRAGPPQSGLFTTLDHLSAAFLCRHPSFLKKVIRQLFKRIWSPKYKPL